jgi:hypothetical protein
VLLAAFLVEAYPGAAALHELIAHLHLKHRVDAGETMGHHRNERARSRNPKLMALKIPPALCCGPVFLTSVIQSSSSRALHRVRIRDFESWLAASGKSPTEVALKCRCGMYSLTDFNY